MICRILKTFFCMIIGVMLGLGVTALLLLAMTHAWARGDGWADTDPAVRQWFQSLMQPDNPAVSCCGEADAYEADTFFEKDGHYVAVVTDERGDTFRNGVTRRHIEPGTRIDIPHEKLKWDQGNPTGHGYIFIGAGGTLYCYVTPAGI